MLLFISDLGGFWLDKLHAEVLRINFDGRRQHNNRKSRTKAGSRAGLKKRIGGVSSPRSYNSRTEAGMAIRDRIKPRGYPDHRGMGAQSDFIAEQFVPSEQYKEQQMEMVEKLIAGGVNPEKVAAMFSIPFNLLSGEKQKGEKP
jgi:hypothetical protein